jgi:hypothetical protein
MLGFFKMPTWWEDEYGPAPYTSGNAVLWDDLELGYIKQGDRQGYDSKYARPGLKSIIPGNLFEIESFIRHSLQQSTLSIFKL